MNGLEKGGSDLGAIAEFPAPRRPCNPSGGPPYRQGAIFDRYGTPLGALQGEMPDDISEVPTNTLKLKSHKGFKEKETQGVMEGQPSSAGHRGDGGSLLSVAPYPNAIGFDA